ncbi:hypothetical protein ABFS82_06G147700 [Erythranthe guttata]|uniref:Exocyst subunit Exo70 family protein n=1 Tax=Erythranthe guttata TaxID=4155 RepID=A0A022QZU6_ERYGU|nr:PREDICTED: exocyst complex component EXO70B1-like [Erythranthe guttata]EYU33194.1 hypothetical protein MIMGU_mgv1a002824mg [Erythranthe guttata]|eukprot:XP_012842508.1 PREDICTED: exocyst complex component EXO70B1-like [Erythranthe guttata]
MAIDGLLIRPTTPRKSTNHHFSPTKFPQTTFSESMMQENIENAETLITKWDPNSPSFDKKFTSLFHENRNEANEFTKSVGELRRAMHFLVAQRSDSNNRKLVLANKLMKIAMLRLEKEFYYILSINRDCLNPESVSNRSSLFLSRSLSLSNSDDEIQELDRVESKAERAMADLKAISETMISSGYSKECSKIYRLTRKSITDEELYRLGIGSYSQSQINRMDQRALEHQVDRWIDRAKVVVRTLFRGERLLCDHVFAVSETIKQTCCAHTTMEGAMNLFKFPEFVAKSKRSPEKILVMMNLFETISDMWPEIESIFSYESLSPVKLQALSAMHKLGDSAQTIISEFVLSVQKNSSKTVVSGGGVHPLTCSVMSYVALLAENSGVLSDILNSDEEGERAAQSPFPESYFDGSPTAPATGVSSRLAWIVLVLLCKLDSKAELYKDIALSYLFLANNIQFVVERVSTTAVKLLLGEEWLSKLRKKVKLYAANYEAVAWGKVVSSLPPPPAAEENEEESSAAAARNATIKGHFRRFNSEFEAAYRKQRAWVVADPKLAEEIKVWIERKVVAAYREFYDNNLGILSGEMDLEFLVRYSPDNLGNYLSGLFHNHTPALVSGNSSSSSFDYSSQSRLYRCL